MSKHKIAGMLNPWEFGLLGGISSAANSMDQWNRMQSQQQARLDAYKVKYDAMGSVAAMRAQNNQLLSQLKLEANQRTYKTQEVGADGKTYDVYNRNVYDPDTKTFRPQEVSRAPAAKQGAPVQTRVVNGQIVALDPDTGKWSPVYSSPNGGVSAAQQAIADRSAARDKAVAGREDTRLSAQKAAKLDSAVSKDMDKFDKADADTKAQMMKSAGVDASVPDTEAHRSLMHPIDGAVDPNATMPN